MPSQRRPSLPAADPEDDDGPTAAEAAAQARSQRAATRFAGEARAALLELVERVHAARHGAGVDIAGLVYKTTRGVRRPTLDGLAAGLAALAPLLAPSAPEDEALRAALNAVLGDQLARGASPLAIRLALRHAGRELAPERAALDTALPGAGERLLVLIHDLGLDDLRWRRPDGHDHGAALAAALGFTPVHVRYDSGLHVSTNGRALAGQLERLLAQWPRPLARFAIVAHGMGGLVARSALHYGRAAAHHWPHRLDDLACLGTPHHGAPLAAGDLAAQFATTPHGAQFARLGVLRSAGLADLAHGNLVDEDWRAGDRAAGATDRRLPLPLPAGPRCFAIAGTLDGDADSDGLVPLASALGRHRLARRTLAFRPEHQRVVDGVGHLQLLSSPAVFEQLRDWLGA